MSFWERSVRMDEWGGEHTFEVEEAWADDWDCTVVFDDEVVGGLDWEKLANLGTTSRLPKGS